MRVNRRRGIGIVVASVAVITLSRTMLWTAAGLGAVATLLMLNGFFLVKGTHAQLEAMRASDEFVDLTVRAGHTLEQVGVIEAYTGPEIPNVMGRWTKLIPQR